MRSVWSSRRAQASTGGSVAPPSRAKPSVRRCRRSGRGGAAGVLGDAGQVAGDGRAAAARSRGPPARSGAPGRAESRLHLRHARAAPPGRPGRGSERRGATRPRSARSGGAARARSPARSRPVPTASRSAVSAIVRVSNPATLSPYQCSWGERDPVTGGLEPDEAAVGGRYADRAHAVRGGGGRAQPGRHRRRAAAARAAGSALGVQGLRVKTERRALGVAHDGQLGRVGLADQHRAGRPQPFDQLAVAPRRAPGMRPYPSRSPRRSRPRRPSRRSARPGSGARRRQRGGRRPARRRPGRARPSPP